jgi:hypothetical protein
MDSSRRIAALEADVARLQALVTALQWPCRCEPPGSGGAVCNGCCWVREWVSVHMAAHAGPEAYTACLDAFESALNVFHVLSCDR